MSHFKSLGCKEHNINIIKSSNKSIRETDRTISCMNKYIDNTLAIFLSNIRNKLYLDIITDFEKLKKDKKLNLYVDDILILVYKNSERKIHRQFSSHIQL